MSIVYTMDLDLNASVISPPMGISLTSPIFGYPAMLICVLGFGVNYMPVKKYDMGDGMAFQWLMSNAILVMGVIINCAVGCPQFYPVAMLGGVLWAVGNSLTALIIQAVGVGLGSVIWSLVNMLLGFATTRFGLYGIPKKIPRQPTMNYVGVAIAFARGVVLALIAGVFFGNTFTPTIYIQEVYPGASKEGLDYVFSNYVGIYITSTTIFVVYALVKRSRPWIPQTSAILPAFLSGAIWSISQAALFIANASLGEPIAYPIATAAPCLISTVCGMLFFSEIRGKKNYIILTIAFSMTILGVILNALSR